MGISRRSLFGVTGAAAASALAACAAGTRNAAPGETSPTGTSRPDINDPAAALAELQKGNQRFVDNRMRHPDQSAEVRQRLSQSQKPFAVLLSCSDSRLPPEVIFDQGLGDLFVIRVAGNIVDRVGMGSIEYAVEHLKTPLIMALGHQNCGAVTATVEAMRPPNTQPSGDVEALVEAIAPAVMVASGRQGDLLDNSVRANAELSRDKIRDSPELKEFFDSGALQVVAAYYSLDTGVVTQI